MNRPFCASSKQLEKKWQDMAYQRHKEKLRTIKPRIKQELNRNRQEENYKIQRRLMRVLGEERRQEMINKENHQLLERILNIMASPSRIDSWNTTFIKGTDARREGKTKESSTKKIKEDRTTNKNSQENTTSLPSINT